MNPYTYQRPKITPLPNETGLTVPGGTGVAVVPNGTPPALKQPYLPGQYTEYPAAVQGWAQQALPGGGSGIEGGKENVPDKAKEIARQVKENNGAPPKGYKGGRTYKNIPLEEGAQKLPKGVNYREYDINPYVKGQNRGPERIVIGDDNSVWYTNDHYYTFTRIE